MGVTRAPSRGFYEELCRIDPSYLVAVALDVLENLPPRFRDPHVTIAIAHLELSRDTEDN